MKDRFRPLTTVVMTGVFIIAFGILFFFLIFRAGAVFKTISHFVNILMPFIIGMILSYLLRPICNMYERWIRKGVDRLNLAWFKNKDLTMAAILLSYISAFLILYILLSSVLPQLIRSILRLTYAVPTYIQVVEESVDKLFAGNAAILNVLNTSTENIIMSFEDWTQTYVIPNLRSIMSNLSTGVIDAVGVVGNTFIGIIASIYILANRHRFLAQGRLILYSLLSEEAAHWVESELKYADSMFTGFLGGKIVDSTIVGIICFIGCQILRIPNALLVSVVVGVTNIIPFFGPYIGLVPSALIILITSPVKCVTFVIFVLFLQQVDGNILGPRILGNSTGLSGFWVLFSILLFGGMWGFIGMIIGVPLFAVIYDIIKRTIHYTLEKKGRKDLIREYEARFPNKDDQNETEEHKEMMILPFLKNRIYSNIMSESEESPEGVKPDKFE